MIIDVTAVNYLNQSSITEAVSGDINMTFGLLMLFIGIIFLYTAFTYYKKNSRNIKRF